MKMNGRWAMAAVAVIGVVMLLAGCSSVTSVQMIGQPLTGEQLKVCDKLEGVWQSGDQTAGVLFIKHVGEGKLKLAALGWQEDHFEKEEFDVTLTMQGDHLLANIQAADLDKPQEGEQPDEAAKDYLFVWLLTLEPDQEGYMLMYVPQAEAFEKAVKAGELAGEVIDRQYSKQVRITAEQAEVGGWMTDERWPGLFDAGQPVVLRRVGDLE